jgi:hypothetical protein
MVYSAALFYFFAANETLFPEYKLDPTPSILMSQSQLHLTLGSVEPGK